MAVSFHSRDRSALVGLVEGPFLTGSADINAPVLNKDMVIHALAGLPYEYESFTTTITNMNANITFADLRTKLLHQELLPEGNC